MELYPNILITDSPPPPIWIVKNRQNSLKITVGEWGSGSYPLFLLDYLYTGSIIHLLLDNDNNYG